jgi:hypothetical protein
MEIVRKFLSSDELSSSSSRYNPECDCVETSPDGGTTWVENPAADPRHADAARLPPLVGEDARCNAAAGMTAHFKAQVDAFLTSAGILQLVNVLIGLLLFIPGVNVLLPLIFGIADALFVIGTEVVDAAMTDPVYEQIQCILFCNTDGNGQVSAEQFDAINDEIEEQIGGIAAEVWRQVTSAWGEVGLSNAGAVEEVEGDCDECDCGWCMEFDFSTGMHGWAVGGFFGANPVGTWTGSGWQTNYDAPNSVASCQIFIDFDVTNVTDIDVRFEGTTGANDNSYVAMVWMLSAASQGGCNNALAGHTTFPPDSDNGCIHETPADQMIVAIGSGQFADIGELTITKITMFGTGENPFGDSNC